MNRVSGETARLWMRKVFAFFEKHHVLTFSLLAAVLNLLIESLARLDPLGGFRYLTDRPAQFLLNTLFLCAGFSVSLLFRRRMFVLSITAIGWLVIGIANAVIVSFRAAPLSGIDFAILRSCFPIVKTYLRTWQAVLIAVFVGLLVFLTVRFFRRARKFKVRFGREILLFNGTILLFITAFSLSVRSGAVETSFTDLPGAYRDYGFVTCFSLSIVERGIEEPADYSEATVRTLIDTLTEADGPERENGAYDGFKPNVVAVQLESFMDPERIGGIVWKESPVPYFSSLKEAYPSGFLRVNTVGAGTANTEFEVLTGIDLTFFGAGEYPYQTILGKEEAVSESMASVLRANGYRAHAVHNHSGSFYDRYRVYGALGFDDFVPLEYMSRTEKNLLGWAKDEVLTDVILDCLDTSDSPDFVFAVSVQGHGMYPSDYPVGKGFAAELPSDWTDAEASQFAYYLGQVREMDEFIRDLIKALENRAAETGEETLLLLYGDHLPCLPYDRIVFADGSDSLDSEYVLIPISETPESAFTSMEDRDLEAWQAGNCMLEAAGADGGILFGCHRVYGGTDSFADALSLLAYDMLYGERFAFGGKPPFARTPVTMGICEIRIDSVIPYPGDGFGDDLLTVSGRNFTPFSVVCVNGRAVQTGFVSSGELTAEAAVKPGDRITVIQRTEDFVTLGECEPMFVSEIP